MLTCRLAQLAPTSPRATWPSRCCLVEVAMVAAVLALLAPVLFVRSREPFERLVVILEVMVRRWAGQTG